MSVSVVAMGFSFNVLNSYYNGIAIYRGFVAEKTDIFTFIGILLFLSGFIILFHSDGIILNIKTKLKSEYAIPQRGFHNSRT